MNDDKFTGEVRSVLNASADDLDELTLARLNAARLRALDAAGTRSWERWFRPLVGAMAACGVAAAALIFIPDPTGPVELAQSASLADEEVEMIRELEFLLWLDQNDAAL